MPLTETNSYPAAIFQFEDGDEVTGGPDGSINAAPTALASRTKYLKGQFEVLSARLTQEATRGPVMPISAVPFPHVATPDHRLVITAAGGTAGGTVLVGANQHLTLGVPVVAGVTARAAAWTTVAWESIELPESTTRYLRGQITPGGALLLYVTGGADDDDIPNSYRCTPNASSGGGCDSTPVDALFAKVLTHGPGIAPTVIPLANMADLRAEFVGSGPATWTGSPAYQATYELSVDCHLARTPVCVTPVGHVTASTVVDGVYVSGWANAVSVTQRTRMTISATVRTDWSGTPGGTLTGAMRIAVS